MKNKKVIVIIAIIAIVVIGCIISYNGLVSKSENVESKLSDLDITLQRRADLIPNLVNTVKGYTNHENEVIEKVTTARTKLVNASTIEEKATANEELSSSLKSLSVIVENYPELQSSSNYMQLSDELAGTENRIAVARRDYNKAVKEYNLKIKKFPSSIFAGMFGFEKTEYFEADESSKEVPSVNFE